MSLILKSLFANERWSKSLWGVEICRIFNATGATILGSCGFKDEGESFSVKLGEISSVRNGLELLGTFFT